MKTPNLGGLANPRNSNGTLFVHNGIPDHVQRDLETCTPTHPQYEFRGGVSDKAELKPVVRAVFMDPYYGYSPALPGAPDPPTFESGIPIIGSSKAHRGRSPTIQIHGSSSNHNKCQEDMSILRREGRDELPVSPWR